MPSLIHVGHWSLASSLQPSVSHSLLASVLAMPSSAGGVESSGSSQPAGAHCACAARVTLRSSAQSAETFYNIFFFFLKMATAEPVSTLSPSAVREHIGTIAGLSRCNTGPGSRFKFKYT